MGQCYISRRGKLSDAPVEQLGVYPTGTDGRPYGNVIVPDGTIRLSQYVFYKNANVNTVVLPDTMRGIDNYAFQTCTSLSSVNIPDRVTSIGNYCFDGDNNLSNINFPSNLTDIGEYAFQNCTSLYDINFSNDWNTAFSNLTVKGYAFSGCSNLGDDVINRITQRVGGTIYSNAFANLKSIREIVTKYTTDYYFKGCSKLYKVTILNALSNGEIGSYIFSDTKIRTVILPTTGLTKISNNAFYNNSNLVNINIPTTVITFGDSAFYGCTNLPDIDIPESVTAIGSYTFSTCTSFTNITIPENVTTLGNSVFYGCTNLTEVYLNCNITTMNYSVFRGCTNLQTVYLPATITTQNSNCLSNVPTNSYHIFYGCNNLQDVQLGNEWNMTLNLTGLNNITAESMINMINALKDLTSQTSKTLTLGSTNLNKEYISDYGTTVRDYATAVGKSKNWTIN